MFIDIADNYGISCINRSAECTFGPHYVVAGFFATKEGGAIPIVNGSSTKWHYEYNFKDHLGNTRATFGRSLIQGDVDLVQRSNYYPFGMAFETKNYNTATTNYQQNKYLYNSKEFQNDGFGGVSLDWYDYGARFYDASLGR